MHHLLLQLFYRFLVLATSGLSLYQASVIPLFQANHCIVDLYSLVGSSFSFQAEYWTINGVIIPGQIKTYQCGTAYVLGGLGILNVGDYLERSYDSLPSHDMISYIVNFFILDNWQPSDKIIITFKDTNHIFSAAPAGLGAANTPSTSLCGDPLYPDRNNFLVLGKIFHNRPDLTIRITSNLASNIKSFGVQGVQFFFRTKSPQSCHASCINCYGPTSKDCYACNNGYGFDGESCVGCTSNCIKCSGPNYNQCNFCFPPFILNWDYTCIASCNPPYTFFNMGDLKICTKTSCQINGTFLYPNQSCLPECPAPYKQRIEGMVKYCDRPCDIILEYYYEDHSRCKLGCEYPYRKKDNAICIKDLSDEEVAEIKGVTVALNVTKAVISHLGTTISLINFANPAAFFLDALSDMFKYIRYMKITYPPKLQAALDAEIEPPFTPIPDKPDQLLHEFHLEQVPEKFEQYELHSSFIINFWKSGITLIIIGAGIIGSCLLEWSSRGFQSVHSFFMKVKHSLKWSFFLGFITSLIGEIVLYTSLEMRALQMNTFLAIFDFLFCLVFNLILLASFMTMIHIIWKIQKATHPSTTNHKVDVLKPKYDEYKILFEPFKQKSFIQQSYMCLFFARSYVFNLIIAYLFNHPLIQIILITILSLLMTFYLIATRPLRQMLDLALYIFQEAVMLLVNICVLVLAIFDQVQNWDLKARRILGDIIIYSNTVFSAVGVAYLLIQTMIIIKDLFSKIRKYIRNKSKVEPGKIRSLDQSSVFELPAGHSLDACSTSNIDIMSNSLHIYPSSSVKIDKHHYNLHHLGHKNSNQQKELICELSMHEQKNFVRPKSPEISFWEEENISAEMGQIIKIKRKSFVPKSKISKVNK